MPVSLAMRRLLGIRVLQEEQRRTTLETALRELEGFRMARVLAQNRARAGRGLVSQSAHSGELLDRLAGLAEQRHAQERITHLAQPIADAEQRAAAERLNYLAARVERRQAETIVNNVVEEDTRTTARKSQADLDEWFRSHSSMRA